MRFIHSLTTHYTYIENEKELKNIQTVCYPIHTKNFPCYVKFFPDVQCHVEIDKRLIKYNMIDELEKVKKEYEEVEEETQNLNDDDIEYLNLLDEYIDELKNELKILEGAS